MSLVPATNTQGNNIPVDVTFGQVWNTVNTSWSAFETTWNDVTPSVISSLLTLNTNVQSNLINSVVIQSSLQTFPNTQSTLEVING